MESEAMPSGLLSQPFSLRAGRTNAEEERAPAEAIAKVTTGVFNIDWTTASLMGMNCSRTGKLLKNGHSVGTGRRRSEKRPRG